MNDAASRVVRHPRVLLGIIAAARSLALVRGQDGTSPRDVIEVI